MKKKYVIAVAVFILLLTALVGCHKQPAPPSAEFTVTLMVDGEVFDAIKVNERETLDSIPTPQADDGYAFEGWFDGENKLTTETVISADVTYVAKFFKNAYVLTYLVSGREVMRKTIPMGQALSADDIPMDVQTTQNELFAGWYAEDVKAEVGLTPDGDMEFAAYILSKSAYEGEWVDKTAHLMVKITSQALTVCAYDAIESEAYDFNLQPSSVDVQSERVEIEEGAISYFDGYGYAAWIFKLLPDGKMSGLGVSYDASAIDSDDDGIVKRQYVFQKCESGSFAEGKYNYGEFDYFVVKDNGVIENVNGTDVFYGYFYAQEDGYQMEYKLASNHTFVTTFSAKVDEKGNVMLDGKKLYIKDITNLTEYKSESGDRLCVFKQGTVSTYVLELGGVCYYATLEGNIHNSQFFITYDGIKTVAKLVDDVLVLSDGDYGTFTGADGELKFDGFGGGTLDGRSIDYSFNKLSARCYISDKVYQLDLKGGTYEVLTAEDEFAGQKFKYDYAKSMRLEIEFDGFGRLEIKDMSSTSATVFGTYDGFYSIDGDVVNLLGSIPELKNGAYSVTYDGNVLQMGFVAFIKQGYEVVDRSEQFYGYWQGEGKSWARVYFHPTYEEIELSLPNESDVTLSKNFDGSELYNSDFDCYITLQDGKLRLDYKNAVRLYTYYGEYEPFGGFESGYVGNWTTGDGMRIDITTNSLSVNGNAAINLRADDYEYFFEYESKTYTLAMDVYDQIGLREDGAHTRKLLYKVAQGALEIDDAFIGVYTGSYMKSDETIPVTLEISENSISLNGASPTYVGVMGASFVSEYYGMAFYMGEGDFAGEDIMLYIGEGEISIRLERKGVEILLTTQLAAFDGKFVNGQESISFDGNGNATYQDGDAAYQAKYTVQNGKACFDANGLHFECEMASSNLSVKISGGETRDVVFEPAKNDFVGTFTGTDSSERNWTFTFDGLNMVTITCDDERFSGQVTYAVREEEGMIVAIFTPTGFGEEIACYLSGNSLYVSSENDTFSNEQFSKNVG